MEIKNAEFKDKVVVITGAADLALPRLCCDERTPRPDSTSPN